jgi:glycolate oxidase FAD binding subunit
VSSTVCSPRDLDEAADAMRGGGRILVRGSGTATDWGGEPSTVDTVVSTAELSGTLAYNPADMTVAVRAGTPLASLQSELAERGQWIANDAARVPTGGTVGGLLATADAGPRQHRYGPLRDLVLGVTVVLADGRIAHSGGHVIKNVAGYDLAKLFAGSYGTLGLVAEVVLRTHPISARSRTLVVESDARTGYRSAVALSERPVEPTAVCWADGRLLIRFEGTDVGIDEQLRHAELTGGDVVSGPDEDALWAAEADVVNGAPGHTVVRVGALPSRFPDLIELVDKLVAEHGVTAGWSASFGVGVHTIALSGGDAAAHARVIAGLTAGFDDAAITRRRRAAGVERLVDAWGPEPPAIALLRSVKNAFDPDGRLGPGRFAPWLKGTE